MAFTSHADASFDVCFENQFSGCRLPFHLNSADNADFSFQLNTLPTQSDM